MRLNSSNVLFHFSALVRDNRRDAINKLRTIFTHFCNYLYRYGVGISCTAQYRVN